MTDRTLAKPASSHRLRNAALAERSRLLPRLFARYLAWRRRRIAVRHLSEFDDYLLSDIGISRSEIFHAARHGRDPRA